MVTHTCNTCQYDTPIKDKRQMRQMVLNIVTPLTRVNNLRDIAKTILGKSFENIIINWHVHVDKSVHNEAYKFMDDNYRTMNYGMFFSDMTGTAGHVHRNSFLILNEWRRRYEGVHVFDEWIMSLDDDNILHADFLPWLSANQQLLSNYSGLIFDQCFRNGEIRLTANPDKITVGNVDTAQYMFRSSIVEGLRFDETRYDADGLFIEELYRRHRDKFLIVNRPLCYYNYLRS